MTFYQDVLTSILSKSLDYFRLGRFQFLLGGIIAYGLGVSVSIYETNRFNGQLFLLGQLIITLTQLMVHYENDYFDLRADQFNQSASAWSGGSGILRDKRIHPSIALVTAIFLLLISSSLVIVLYTLNLIDFAPLVLFEVGIALSWFYSAPPLQLHSIGLGEISATVILSVLTPILGFYLQSHYVSFTLLYAILPICLLQFNMLIAVALPDRISDIEADKRTLVVILGEERAKRLYAALLALSFCLVPIIQTTITVSIALAYIVFVPVALYVIYIMFLTPQKSNSYSKIAFLSIVLLEGVTLLQALMFFHLFAKA